MPNNPNETGNKEHLTRTVRILWMILIGVFAAVIWWRLYNSSQGGGSVVGLREIAAPLGMIFIGLATITGTRNKPLYYVFLVIAIILVISGLVMNIMY